MKKSVLILAGLALTISSLHLKLVAQNANTLIKGKIIDNTFKTPVGFAYVTIKDSSSLITTISDKDGTFFLFDITDGCHYIQISRQGYKDTVMPVNVSPVKEQEIIIALNNKVKPDMIVRRLNDNGNIDESLKIYTAPDFLFKVVNAILNSFQNIGSDKLLIL